MDLANRFCQNPVIILSPPNLLRGVSDVDQVKLPPLLVKRPGVWERMTRSVREILLAVMPKKTLIDDELHTVLLEIEAIVNLRPLPDVPMEHNENTPFPPNHLLRVNYDVALSPF